MGDSLWTSSIARGRRMKHWHGQNKKKMDLRTFAAGSWGVYKEARNCVQGCFQKNGGGER